MTETIPKLFTVRSMFSARILAALVLYCASIQGALSAMPPSIPTEIEVQVVLLDINSIDSSREQFTANVGMWARWTDPRLANTVAEPTFMDLDEVWHPIFQVINQQKIFQTFEPAALVHPDGTVEVRQRMWGDFSQALNLRNFPLDTQTIGVRVVAAGNGPEAIRFIESPDRPSGVADKITLSDWQVRGHQLDFSPYKAFKGVLPLASYALYAEVRRYRGYYALKILLPLMLIISMSYLVFWVPRDAASSRFSIAVTSMLTLIAYRFMVGGLLPKVSYMTRMDTFVMLSTIMVFLTLLAVVLTGLWEQEKPEKATRLNKLARAGFPPLLLLVLWVSFRA